MDDKPRWFGVRDLFWIAVLALVLAAWGWDRGRLSVRLDHVSPPIPEDPFGGMPLGGLAPGGTGPGMAPGMTGPGVTVYDTLDLR